MLGRQKHLYVGRKLKKLLQGSDRTQFYMAIKGPFRRFLLQPCTVSVKQGLHLDANGTRHAKTKPLFSVGVLPRQGKQHSAVRETFSEQSNAIYQLLVQEREFAYNTFMYGRVAASENAEQCTNVPYILSRLSSACFVRIQI